MEIVFEIVPENYVGYKGGIVVIHIKQSEFTPKVQSYLEEKVEEMNIEKAYKENFKK